LAGFLRHTSCDSCGSSDGKAEYDDGSSHCFVCLKTVPSDEWIDSQSDSPNKSYTKNKVKVNTKVKDKIVIDEKKVSKACITPEESQEVKDKTSMSGNNYRGISDAVLKFYGCRTEFEDEDESEVKARYYPITIQDKLSGWKVREHPKSFYAIGNTGNDCDLYGAFRFRSGGKYLLICEGESDAHASYQMFKEYSESKGSDFITAVVSITTGAGNPAKQLATNYEFLSLFDNIVLGFDSDEPGKKAIDKAITALPKGHVKICTWSKCKDPNEYLLKGQQKQFISDFYNAKTYVPTGVMASTDLYDKIIEQANVAKVPFPPFLKTLETMIGGGLILGHAYNIGAMTSIGKTAVVNELVYWWIYNSPHLVGIVSMELNSGQYGEAILSRHLQTKLARLDVKEKMIQLESDSIRQKGKELFTKEDGTPRFYLVDDRDGSTEQIQDVIEQMVISSGVKIIVIDPLQDIIGNLSNEEQGVFMTWVKSMIKSHNVSFVLINHLRKKSGGDTSIKVSESDIMGSSTIMKSASVNILLARDKEAEDEIERNTTYVTLPKSRLTGDTGPAGKIYYDKYTHVMHDFDEYFGNTTGNQTMNAQVKQPKLIEF